MSERAREKERERNEWASEREERERERESVTSERASERERERERGNRERDSGAETRTAFFLFPDTTSARTTWRTATCWASPISRPPATERRRPPFAKTPGWILGSQLPTKLVTCTVHARLFITPYTLRF